MATPATPATPAPTPPVPPPPAPLAPPAPTTHQRSWWHHTYFVAIAATILGFMLGALSPWNFQPRPIPPVPQPAPVKNLLKPKKVPMVVQEKPIELPPRKGVVINNYNVQQAKKEEIPVSVVSQTPQVVLPAVPSPPPVTINNYNIQQSEAPAAPQSAPAPVTQTTGKPKGLITDPVVIGEPQTFYNSWGWWLVDPNGGFHCPPVSNPTTWRGGMGIWVQRKGTTYETWAPACYR
mgnify:CR=1 FL=1